ncbi:potassium channel protein [Synechococcus sp. H60.2]|uniref:potassium channel family protein n=1 Tax=Synechococcus sp. H60.2 TaxID=2964518 RepID=UPI0039C204FC
MASARHPFPPANRDPGIRRDLGLGVGALLGVVLIGTLWYHRVEQWPWVEAFYMSVITLTTVGFMEVRPLGNRGRLFTVALILMGVLSIGFMVNRFTEALIQGHFQEGIRQRKWKKQMEALNNHYIVCGFGRIGRQVAQEFQAEGVPFLVIDQSAEAIQVAQELGYIALHGDSTLDATLLAARVQQAEGLIAALSSDAENLYVVLSARTLNPRIRAIARANTEEALQKLQRAGVAHAISPYITGGKRMAAAALRPRVVDFVDGILSGRDRTFYLEEYELAAQECPYVGQTLGKANLRARSGALVVAIRRADGQLIGGPSGDTLLQPGDLLLCMGTAEQLRRLDQLLYPRP